MGVPFPAVQPSSRRFVAPRWAVTPNRSQSGVTTKRLWGSKPSDAQLSLSFNNKRDEVAAQILAAYEQAKGSTTEVDLPAEVFQGTTGTLNIQLRELLRQNGLRWFFRDDDPPEVESVVPGISNIRVNLTAELRMD